MSLKPTPLMDFQVHCTIAQKIVSDHNSSRTNASYDHDFFFWVANSNLKFCVAVVFLMFSLKNCQLPTSILIGFLCISSLPFSQADYRVHWKRKRGGGFVIYYRVHCALLWSINKNCSLMKLQPSLSLISFCHVYILYSPRRVCWSMKNCTFNMSSVSLSMNDQETKTPFF